MHSLIYYHSINMFQVFHAYLNKFEAQKRKLHRKGTNMPIVSYVEGMK